MLNRALSPGLLRDTTLLGAREAAAAQQAATRAGRPASFVHARRLVRTSSGVGVAGVAGGGASRPASPGPPASATGSTLQAVSLGQAFSLASQPTSSIPSLAAMGSLACFDEGCDLEVTLSQLHLIVPADSETQAHT